MSVERTYSPLAPLQEYYEAIEPEFSFRAESPDEWQRWREGFRTKLGEILGGFPSGKCALEPEVLEVTDKGNYVREKVVFQSEPKVSVPAYFLIPKQISTPAPAILALHGHGRGKDDCAGIAETPEDVEGIRSLNYNAYGEGMAERGYITLIPDQCCFGERMEEQHRQEKRGSSCRQVSFFYQLLGKTVIGQRVWDGMRAIDYLQTRPEVNPERIACMGLSGGATAALYLAALEERVKVVVASGYLSTFRDSILAMDHCECNYIPGILKHGKMADMASLIAPRALLIESGTEDSIFPIQATELAFERLKRAYDLLGVPERLDKDIFEGGHKFSGRKAYDWINQWV